MCLARQSGFIRRQRRLKALDFLVLMTFGIAGMVHPSLAGMVDAIRANMSREALHLRFTPYAVAFMQRCVEFVLKQRINSCSTIRTDLLSHYTSVKIFDSSSWGINSALSAILPGSGGNASTASCKVQVCYEYLRGTLSFFDIVAGKKPDHAYADDLDQHIAPGELLMADLGYFRLDVLSAIIRKAAYFVFRLHPSAALFAPATGRQINLATLLRTLTKQAYECDVLIGAKEINRVKCRLICLRVSDEIAARRRSAIRQNARKKGRTPSQESLFLAGWILMVTNTPREWLPADMVRPLYALRWQIELLFRQLKSTLRMPKSVTGNEHRLRCEILGKLIVAILVHRMHAELNAKLWRSQRQEVSMEKLYKRITERAFIIAAKLCTSVSKATAYLQNQMEIFKKSCRL